MNSLFSLKGKTALVTGGGRGIGQSIANGLVTAGASVAILEKKLPELHLHGIRYYQTDISVQESLKNSFDQFVADFGEINILVNCAGISISCVSHDYPIEDWKLNLDVNLTATFLACQMAGKKMIEQVKGGSIINVTSIGSAQGFPRNPAYCASKGGVSQLTKAFAFDWGEFGIRVNNLAPGYTHTPMNQKSWDDPQLRKIREDCTLLGRWAEPEEMVGPAIFLASDASSYITGIDLVVDGGWLVKGM